MKPICGIVLAVLLLMSSPALAEAKMVIVKEPVVKVAALRVGPIKIAAVKPAPARMVVVKPRSGKKVVVVHKRHKFRHRQLVIW